MNLRAVDETLAHLYEVEVPATITPKAAAGNGHLKDAPAICAQRARRDHGRTRRSGAGECFA